MCCEVGEQGGGVQQAVLHLEKVSFINCHVCLILKVCTNAAKSSECCKPAFNQPVRILRIVPTVLASEIPGDLVERNLS